MAVERKSYSAVLWLTLLAAALVSIAPFIWIIAGSFKPHLEIQAGRVWPWQSYHATGPEGREGGDKHITTENYEKIFGQLSGLPTYYFNTAYLAVAGTFLALLVGSLAAYGFARFRFAGNKFLFTLLLLTIMIDGAGTWRVFWDLMVPIGRNGLAACAILTFLGIWNEFLFALTFTSMEQVRTLPVGIVMLRGQYGLFNSGVLFATVLLSFLPIVIVFLLLQKYFVRGLSAGALKA